MAKREIFTCDRCGYEQDRDRKFNDEMRWMRTITLFVEDGHAIRQGVNFHHIASRDRHGSVLWCDKCCEDSGLNRITKVTTAKANEQPEPTIEDIIREIVREETGVR
jgi:hypothetical protein